MANRSKAPSRGRLKRRTIRARARSKDGLRPVARSPASTRPARSRQVGGGQQGGGAGVAVGVKLVPEAGQAAVLIHTAAHGVLRVAPGVQHQGAGGGQLAADVRAGQGGQARHGGGGGLAPVPATARVASTAPFSS